MGGGEERQDNDDGKEVMGKKVTRRCITQDENEQGKFISTRKIDHATILLSEIGYTRTIEIRKKVYEDHPSSNHIALDEYRKKSSSLNMDHNLRTN